MRHELRTEIDIAAPPERVWEVLVDLPSHEDWNPFITSATGRVAVGERLRLRLAPPDARAVTLRPRVTVVEPSRSFEWLGHLGIPGLFDGRHRFDLEPVAGGTRFVHAEHFRGVLVRPLWRLVGDPTRAGFEAMNAALAERVTSAAGA